MTRAQRLADDLNAKAFTHGNKIFLGRKQSPHDMQLMAHELTHTAQQAASGHTPSIQRQDDEETKKCKKTIRKLKAKQNRNRALGVGLDALELRTNLPLHMIDKASGIDMHVKDIVRFLSTGKTRKQRFE